MVAQTRLYTSCTQATSSLNTVTEETAGGVHPRPGERSLRKRGGIRVSWNQTVEVIVRMIALETKSAKDEVAEAKAFKKDLE